MPETCSTSLKARPVLPFASACEGCGHAFRCLVTLETHSSGPLADRQFWHQLREQSRGWAEVLKLPFRQDRWRGQMGEFAGTSWGSSLDFQDHRAYLPGDDPRQINWQAYARTGSYTMKVYREEVRPCVDLILDVSASMRAFRTKGLRVMELLAFVLETALQSGATLRAFAVRGAEHRLLEVEALVSGGWPLEFEAVAALPSEAAPVLTRLPLRPGSMRLLLSDLLFPTEPEAFLAPLATRQGRGIVLAPFCQEESSPGWTGKHEFVDAETGMHQEHRVEADMLRQYLQAYTRHFDLWKAAAAKHGISLARVNADVEFLTALRTEGIPARAVEVA